MNDGPVFCTVHEAACLLGCQVQHAYYLIYMGELEAVKVRWIYRIYLDSLEEYASRTDAGKAENDVAGHPEYPGYLFGIEGFSDDSPPRAGAEERAAGVSGGRGMVGEPRRFSGISGTKRHAVTVPVQYELAIA